MLIAISSVFWTRCIYMIIKATCHIWFEHNPFILGSQQVFKYSLNCLVAAEFLFIAHVYISVCTLQTSKYDSYYSIVPIKLSAWALLVMAEQRAPNQCEASLCNDHINIGSINNTLNKKWLSHREVTSQFQQPDICWALLHLWIWTHQYQRQTMKYIL